MTTDQQLEAVTLLPCPFCQQQLVRLGSGGEINATCETPGCWLADRRISFPLDVPRNVAAWNTRTALSQPVPSQPTVRMAIAGRDKAQTLGFDKCTATTVTAIYRAMIAAKENSYGK